MNTIKMTNSTHKLVNLIKLILHNYSEILNIMNSIDFSVKEIELYCTWDKKKYCRNLVFKNESFEILVLCWDIQQKSEIHNHNNNHCFVKILNGRLIERKYNKNNKELILQKEKLLSQDEVIYSKNNNNYHSIGNYGAERAISIHLYMPPLTVYTIYNNKKFKTNIVDEFKHA